MNPLWIVGGFLGIFTTVFLIAFLSMKEKKEAIGFDRNMKDGVIIRRLLGYARPYVGSFLLVGLVMSFTVAADILLPLLIGDITGLLQVEGTRYPAILLRVLLYAVILLLSLAATYLQAVILQKTGQKIISEIRLETFRHIETLSPGQLAEIPVGTLVTRVTNDTNSVSMMFTGLIVNLVRNICLVIGVTVAMLCVNVKLALSVLAFAPFIVLFTVIFRKFTRRAYREVKTATTNINVFLSENLSGIKLTQMFCQENTKLEEFRERNRACLRAKKRQIFVFGIFRPCIYMLYIFSVLVLIFLGGTGALEGASFAGQIITGSTIVVFYQYISSFFTPIQNLAEQFNVLQSAFASSEKIFTILDRKPAIVDAPDAVEFEIKGEIEFKDVWFAYQGEDWVLKGVSFRIPAGGSAAFVGPTGAGKSTILSLLCRNYEASRGEILIDGVEIHRIKLASLRSQLGQMLQDVFLFSGTVRSNIDLRDDGIPEEEIRRACRYVNADRFIDRLDGGLSEEVRERGSNFSAGQRQLLSFARTVLHNPRVLILDEATANIDTETEQLIQDSLTRLSGIGTMLTVAHRLSTIQHAGQIFVLSSGEIVESGTHQELLRQKGRYYDLYRLQFESERLAKAN